LPTRIIWRIDVQNSPTMTNNPARATDAITRVTLNPPRNTQHGEHEEHRWVFPSREGTALEERNMRHVFTRMLEKAELRRIRIHDLRHSYATHFLQAGALITYVSQQLGHADASITLRVYAHYLPDASQREVDRLDDALPAHPNASPFSPR
jgi:integrase